MSWSSSKGRIRGKIASGGFAQPDNTLADAIDTGAGIMAKGIMKRAEEERAEKKRAKAAAAAEARRLAAAQRKKEEAALKTERQVRAISARMGIDPSNEAASDYVRSQVEAFGTSAAALIDADFKAGKISLPTNDVTAEMQGPDVASDFEVQVDGIDSPVAVDDLEAISTEMLLPQETRDAARTQMDVTAPVSEVEPEVVGQEQGFVVDPNAEKVDIDWMAVDETSVKNIRRLHDTGKQALSPDDLEVLEMYEQDFASARAAALDKENLEAVRDLAGKDIDYLQDVVNAPNGTYPPEFVTAAQAKLDGKIDVRDQEQTAAAMEATLADINNFASLDASERKNTIDALTVLAPQSETAQLALDAVSAMTAGKSVDTTSFYTGVATVASIEAKIKLAKRSLTGTAQAAVLEDLEELLAGRKSEKTDLGLTDTVVFGTVTIDGTPVQSELVLTKSGEYYSPLQNKTYKGSEVTDPMTADNAEGLVTDATKIQTAVFAPMLEQRAGITTLLTQAKTIDDLVRESDGKVLTLIGGRLPSLVTRIVNEYESFEAFVAKAGKDDLTELASENMPDAETLRELGISANQFARFNSQAIEFAFTYARTGMGQQRTTDQDFQAAFKVVTAGSGYPTYTQSLRELTLKGIGRAQTEHDKFLDHPTLMAANIRPGAADIYGNITTPLMKYLGNQGEQVAAQLAWANGQGMPTSEDTSATKTPEGNPPVDINAALNKYLSAPSFNADKQTYAGLPEGERDMFLTILSKQTGLPKDLLSQNISQ